MRKSPLTLDRLMLVSAFIFQVVQFTRAFLLLDTGLLAWLSGITGGIMSASAVTYIASRAPRVAGKKAARAAWVALGAILVISPVVIAITNYITVDARLSGVARYTFAACAALIADAFIAGVAFAGGSLLPVQSDAKPKAATPEPTPAPAEQPRSETFSAACECGWSHNSYGSALAARNALNAHKGGREHKEQIK